MWLEASSAHILAFHLHQLHWCFLPSLYPSFHHCHHTFLTSFVQTFHLGLGFDWESFSLLLTFLAFDLSFSHKYHPSSWPVAFWYSLHHTQHYTFLCVCPTTTTTFILCHLISHNHHHVDSSATQVWGHYEHCQQGLWQCTGLHRRLWWGLLVRLCRVLHISHHNSVLHRLSVYNLETIRVALTPPAAGLEKEIWRRCEVWFLCSGFLCVFLYIFVIFHISCYLSSLPSFISFGSSLYLH